MHMLKATNHSGARSVTKVPLAAQVAARAIASAVAKTAMTG